MEGPLCPLSPVRKLRLKDVCMLITFLRSRGWWRLDQGLNVIAKPGPVGRRDPGAAWPRPTALPCPPSCLFPVDPEAAWRSGLVWTLYPPQPVYSAEGVGSRSYGAPGSEGLGFQGSRHPHRSQEPQGHFFLWGRTGRWVCCRTLQTSGAWAWGLRGNPEGALMTECLSFVLPVQQCVGESGTSPGNVFPRAAAHFPASFPQRCPCEFEKRCVPRKACGLDTRGGPLGGLPRIVFLCPRPSGRGLGVLQLPSR